MQPNEMLAHYDNLQPGVVLTGRTHSYVIERLLGYGHTSVVYLAKVQDDNRLAAIKVLRPDAAEFTQANFWNEGLILAELTNSGVSCIPQCLEIYRGQENELRFIAFEYIDQKRYRPLDSLVQDAPLPEAEALEITAQALTLFTKLHEQVQRTYTDMQMKNFCWDGQQLKVMDWNHVSSRREFITTEELLRLNVPPSEQDGFEVLLRRDLTRFGVYLYRLLTTKGANEQTGETRVRLETLGAEGWKKLSVAVQNVLVAALNPARRYAGAAAFLEDVRKAQTWLAWPGDGNDEASKALRREIKNCLDDADEAFAEAKRVGQLSGEQRKKLEALRDADAKLDVLKRCGMPNLDGLRERLAALTRGASEQWARGKFYYEAKQYRQALMDWETEARIQGRLTLWRWVAVAQAAVSAPALRADLEKMVEYLEGGKIEEAAAALQASGARSAAIAEIEPLRVEVRMQLLDRQVNEAQGVQDPKKWRQAADLYHEMAEHLETLPPDYQLALRAEYGWNDLKASAELWKQKAAAYEEGNQNIEKLKQLLLAPGVWAESDSYRDFYQDAFVRFIARAPVSPQLCERMLQYARGALDKGSAQDQIQARNRLEQFYCFAQFNGVETYAAQIKQLCAELRQRISIQHCAEALQQQNFHLLPIYARQARLIAPSGAAYQKLTADLQQEFTRLYELPPPPLLEALEAVDLALTVLNGAGDEMRRAQIDRRQKEFERHYHSAEQGYWSEFMLWANDEAAKVAALLIGQSPGGYDQALERLQRALTGADDKLRAWGLERPSAVEGDHAPETPLEIGRARAQRWFATMEAQQQHLNQQREHWRQYEPRLKESARCLEDALRYVGQLNLDDAGRQLEQAAQKLQGIPDAVADAAVQRERLDICRSLCEDARMNNLPALYEAAQKDYAEFARWLAPEQQVSAAEPPSPKQMTQRLQRALETMAEFFDKAHEAHWQKELALAGPVYTAAAELSNQLWRFQQMARFAGAFDASASRLKPYILANAAPRNPYSAWNSGAARPPSKVKPPPPPPPPRQPRWALAGLLAVVVLALGCAGGWVGRPYIEGLWVTPASTAVAALPITSTVSMTPTLVPLASTDTLTPSAAATATASASPSPSPTQTKTPTSTPTASPAATETPVAASSDTPVGTPTVTPTTIVLEISATAKAKVVVTDVLKDNKVIGAEIKGQVLELTITKPARWAFIAREADGQVSVIAPDQKQWPLTMTFASAAGEGQSYPAQVEQNLSSNQKMFLPLPTDLPAGDYTLTFSSPGVSLKSEPISVMVVDLANLPTIKAVITAEGLKQLSSQFDNTSSKIAPADPAVELTVEVVGVCRPSERPWLLVRTTEGNLVWFDFRFAPSQIDFPDNPEVKKDAKTDQEIAKSLLTIISEVSYLGKAP